MHVNPDSVQSGSPGLGKFNSSTDKGVLANLEQKLKKVEEECRMEESRRVDLELSIMEVKDNLKKAEAGPVTLGTAVDTTHLDNMSPRVSAGHCGSPELYVGLTGHTSGGVGFLRTKLLTQPLFSSLATAQSCHPQPHPRLHPSQLCICAQEQASFSHGHRQRHGPAESQGKRPALAPGASGSAVRWGLLAADGTLWHLALALSERCALRRKLHH